MDCIACGANNWQALPVLNAAMCSDGKWIDLPLAKTMCKCCGLLRHSDPSLKLALEGLYENNYQLHAEPANQFDLQRAYAYANWLKPWVDQQQHLFEIGCGNGALLLALREQHNLITTDGIEPNSSAADIAAGQGLGVTTGLFNSATPILKQYNCVLSVNVFEHVNDPADFLMAIHSLLKPDGVMLLICPNGAEASTELLFADHIHSFTPHAVILLMERCGWVLKGYEVSPAQLPGFQLFIAQAVSHAKREKVQLPSFNGPGLHLDRKNVLQAWAALDKKLCACLNGQPIGVFGCGEFALLLRCYAPDFWRHVSYLTSETSSAAAQFNLPWWPLDAIARGATVFVATRTAVQSVVIAKLSALGINALPVDL